MTTPWDPGDGYVLDWEDPYAPQLPTVPPQYWKKQYNEDGSYQRLSATPTPFVWTVWTQMLPWARHSNRSARFELHKGETFSSGPRAELSEVGLEPYRRDRWYGFSIALPSDKWAAPDKSGEVLVQWHQNYDYGSPPLAIFTDDGRWKIEWHTSDVTDPTAPDADMTGVIDCGEYVTDRWTDWVVHAQWNLENDAFVDVWKDGSNVLQHPGRNVYQNPTLGHPDPGRERVYMKFGIYKWTWDDTCDPSNTTERVVYHDELRIADGDTLRRANKEGELEVAPWTAAWSFTLLFLGRLTITFYRHNTPRLSWE